MLKGTDEWKQARSKEDQDDLIRYTVKRNVNLKGALGPPRLTNVLAVQIVLRWVMECQDTEESNQ